MYFMFSYFCFCDFFAACVRWRLPVVDTNTNAARRLRMFHIRVNEKRLNLPRRCVRAHFHLLSVACAAAASIAVRPKQTDTRCVPIWPAQRCSATSAVLDYRGRHLSVHFSAEHEKHINREPVHSGWVQNSALFAQSISRALCANANASNAIPLR